MAGERSARRSVPRNRGDAVTTKRKARELGRLIVDSYKEVLEALVAGNEWGPDIAAFSEDGASSSARVGQAINRGWVVRVSSHGSHLARYAITELGIHALTYARIERGEYADVDSSRKRFLSFRDSVRDGGRGAAG